MKEYKVIALDIDGTLTRNDKTISPRTRDAVIKAQEMGVKIVICSGRPAYGIAPLADELRIGEYGGFVVAYNGGQIVDWATKETVYSVCLADDVKPVVCDVAKKHGFTIFTYCGKEIITEHPDNQYVQHSSRGNKMAVRKVDDFCNALDYDVNKCMIVGDPDELARFEPVVVNAVEGMANAYRSEAFFLEVVPQGVEKSVGLSNLLDHLGLTREQLMAFGDGYNDRGMIEYAGMGIAMANAKDTVKAVADYVTLSNEEDGVADAIERIGLIKNSKFKIKS